MARSFSAWRSPERSQMTRSLHFKPWWQFLHCAIRTIYQRLAKPRKEPNGQIQLGWPCVHRTI